MESCNPDQESGLQAAWEHLGNAVVERAALDYIRAVKALRAHPEDEASAAMVRDCEDFFCTNRIQLFSAIYGRALLEELRREVQGQHLGRKKPMSAATDRHGALKEGTGQPERSE